MSLPLNSALSQGPSKVSEFIKRGREKRRAENENENEKMGRVIRKCEMNRKGHKSGRSSPPLQTPVLLLQLLQKLLEVLAPLRALFHELVGHLTSDRVERVGDGELA